MTLERLSNERWGFDSNCFVCEPTNAAGLRQAFYHDTDAHTVVATLELGPEHSGAPAYVHGGVQLALLDEAMAWAAIACAGCFAVTATFRSEFLHPIKVGSIYKLAARITAASGSTVEAQGRIFDDRDRDRTTASCTMVRLTEARALDAGAAPSAVTRRFLRE